jgi:hypothetical protein
MKQIPTIHELRKKGWKVRVGHFRNFYRFDPKTGKKNSVTVLYKVREESYPDYYLDSKGGYTVISINVPEKSEELVGFSNCSEEELYCRKTGVKKALARALSLLQ